MVGCTFAVLLLHLVYRKLLSNDFCQPVEVVPHQVKLRHISICLFIMKQRNKIVNLQLKTIEDQFCTLIDKVFSTVNIFWTLKVGNFKVRVYGQI